MNRCILTISIALGLICGACRNEAAGMSRPGASPASIERVDVHVSDECPVIVDRHVVRMEALLVPGYTSRAVYTLTNSSDQDVEAYAEGLRCPCDSRVAFAGGARETLLPARGSVVLLVDLAPSTAGRQAALETSVLLVRGWASWRIPLRIEYRAEFPIRASSGTLRASTIDDVQRLTLSGVRPFAVRRARADGFVVWCEPTAPDCSEWQVVVVPGQGAIVPATLDLLLEMTPYPPAVTHIQITE